MPSWNWFQRKFNKFIQAFSFKEMHLKLSSAKNCQVSSGFNILRCIPLLFSLLHPHHVNISPAGIEPFTSSPLWWIKLAGAVIPSVVEGPSPSQGYRHGDQEGQLLDELLPHIRCLSAALREPRRRLELDRSHGDHRGDPCREDPADRQFSWCSERSGRRGLYAPTASDTATECPMWGHTK